LGCALAESETYSSILVPRTLRISRIQAG
jgi:hypothetical protein